MAGAAPSPPSPRRRGRAGSIALALLALLLLLLGFTVVSSLGAAVSANRWWMLALGLTACVALPALLASWIRSLRRGGGEKRRVGPSTVSSIAVANLLFALGGGLLAPATTAAQLRRHGAWWVASVVGLFGQEPDNPVVRGARRSWGWLAGVLHGEERAPVGDGATPPRDAAQDGPATADAGGREAADLALPDGAPAGAGEIRVGFERRGAAVVVPVRLHGQAGQLATHMLLDTGASLTTLNAQTLRQLGVFVSPGDPTIETRTASGKARRLITVIEGVTLGAARIDGGVTVALCEPCAGDGVVGLLGLNVLRHFRVTLDDEDGQVVLQPRRAGDPRGDLPDIRPFVELRRIRGRWRGPMLTVEAVLHNRAPRAVSYIKLVAVVRGAEGSGKVWGEVRDVPARTKTEVRLQGLSSVKDRRFQLRVERADW